MYRVLTPKPQTQSLWELPRFEIIDLQPDIPGDEGDVDPDFGLWKVAVSLGSMFNDFPNPKNIGGI